MKAPRNIQRFSCTLEIVAEQESDDAGGNIIRVKTDSGQNLLSLSIERELGQHVRAEHTEATASINIDGSVIVTFDGEFQPSDQATAVALDQLIADAISTDMLEDEPDAAAMLAEFRSRVLKSLELVDQAIASLTKA